MATTVLMTVRVFILLLAVLRLVKMDMLGWNCQTEYAKDEPNGLVTSRVRPSMKTDEQERGKALSEHTSS